METLNSFTPIPHLDNVEEMQEAVSYFQNKVYPGKARLCALTISTATSGVVQLAGFIVDETDKNLTLFMPMITGLSMDRSGEKSVLLTSYGFSPIVTLYNSIIRTRSSLVYELKAAYCTFVAGNIDEVLGIISDEDKLSMDMLPVNDPYLSEYEHSNVLKMSELLAIIIPPFSKKMSGIADRASRLAERHSRLFPKYSSTNNQKVDLYTEIMDNLDEDDEIKYN